jgi:Na+/H+ antiporter NhaD/arsenite permease-like protein
MGIAAKEGARSSFFDFVKIGLPFTLAGVLGASLFIWLAVP